MFLVCFWITLGRKYCLCEAEWRIGGPYGGWGFTVFPTILMYHRIPDYFKHKSVFPAIL